MHNRATPVELLGARLWLYWVSPSGEKVVLLTSLQLHAKAVVAITCFPMSWLDKDCIDILWITEWWLEKTAHPTVLCTENITVFRFSVGCRVCTVFCSIWSGKGNHCLNSENCEKTPEALILPGIHTYTQNCKSSKYIQVHADVSRQGLDLQAL